MTVVELKDLDPFDNQKRIFECTVTVAKLLPNSSWYYPACNSCLSTFRMVGSTFRCTKDNCTSTSFDNRYKLSLIMTDETGELQLVIFDKKAQMLIGKPLHILQNKYDRFEIPPDVANLVGQKFTFIVRLQSKKKNNARDFCFQSKKKNNARDFCFEIVYTKHQHGKESGMHPSHGIQGHQIFAAQSSFQNKRKPLIPITSKETTKQDNTITPIQYDTEIDAMDVEQSDDDNNKTSFASKRRYSSTMPPSPDGTFDKRKD